MFLFQRCWRSKDVSKHITDRDNPLLAAVRAGDVARVRSEMGVYDNFYSVDNYNRNAVSLAVLYGHEQVVEVLLDVHMDANVVSRRGDFPLLIAARKKNLSMLSRLLRAHGINVNLQSPKGETALMAAVQSAKNYDMVMALLQAGAASVYVTNAQGETAVDIARATGHSSLAELVEEYVRSHCSEADLYHYITYCAARLANQLHCSLPKANLRLQTHARTLQRCLRGWMARLILARTVRLKMLAVPTVRVQAVWRGYKLRQLTTPLLQHRRVLELADAGLSAATALTDLAGAIVHCITLLEVQAAVLTLMQAATDNAVVYSAANKLATPRIPDHLYRMRNKGCAETFLAALCTAVPGVLFDGLGPHGRSIFHLAVADNDLTLLQRILPLKRFQPFVGPSLARTNHPAIPSSRPGGIKSRVRTMQACSTSHRQEHSRSNLLSEIVAVGQATQGRVHRDTLTDDMEDFSMSVARCVVWTQPDGHTDVTLACELGRLEVVSLYQQHCPSDFDQRRAGTQRTPLMEACRAGHVEVGRLLLASDAIRLSLTVMDNTGYTALHWAVQAKNPVLVQLLVEAGAAINQPTASTTCSTPLGLAAMAPQNTGLALIDVLLDLGAILDGTDAQGNTPLGLALTSGNLTVAYRLVAAGATTDHVNGANACIIELAAQAGQTEVLCFLTQERVARLKKALDAGNFVLACQLSAFLLGLQGHRGGAQPLMAALAAKHGETALFLLERMCSVPKQQHRTALAHVTLDDWASANSASTTLAILGRLLDNISRDTFQALQDAKNPVNLVQVREIFSAVCSFRTRFPEELLPLVDRVVLNERLLQHLEAELCQPHVNESTTRVLEELPWTADELQVILRPLLVSLFRHYATPSLQVAVRRIISLVPVSTLIDLTPVMALALRGTPDVDCSFTVPLLNDYLMRLPVVQTLTSELMQDVNFMQRLAKLQRSSTDRSKAVLLMATYFADYVQRCAICGDIMSVGKPVALQTAYEQWRKQVCEHEFCGDCLAAWIHTRVQDQSTSIACPHPGCSYRLYKDDVNRLGSPEDAKHFSELLTRDYSARLTQVGQDPMLVEWLAEFTRKCPGCSVIVERSQGCSSMICTCGHMFNWDEAPKPV